MASARVVLVLWSGLLATVVGGACNATTDPDDYPVGPGGGGGGVGGTKDRPDAAVDANADAAPSISGRVCLLRDLRNVMSCDATGAAGLVVRLGSEAATTLDDGSFTINRPSGSELVWQVSGNAVVTSRVPLRLGSAVVPAIRSESYDDVLAANTIVVDPGEGSVHASLIRGGMPLANATATTDDASPKYPPMYDGDSAEIWDRDVTGNFGVVWLPGLDVGVSSVTAVPASGTPITTPVIVESQAITFVTSDVP